MEAGESVTAKVVIRNRGMSAGLHQLILRGISNSSESGEIRVVEDINGVIGSNEEIEVSIEISTFELIGNIELSISVDPYDNVLEYNEDNNTGTAVLDVTGPAIAAYLSQCGQ